MNFQRVRSWLRPGSTVNEPASVPPNHDEVRQLELLLGELELEEQRLPSDHWTQMAHVMHGRVANQRERPHQTRPSRWGGTKPLLNGLLPFGGLLALGLIGVGNAEPSEFSVPLDHVASAWFAEPDAVATPDSLAEIAAAMGAPVMSPTEDVGLRERVPRPTNEMSHTTAQRHHRAARLGPADGKASSIQDRTPLKAPAAALGLAQRRPLIRGDEGPTAVARVEPRRATEAETDGFAKQLAALKRADRALKQGREAAAKAELSLKFSPELRLHADALRAVLACQDGHLDTGRRYLTDQAARHPQSPYLDRMRRACNR